MCSGGNEYLSDEDRREAMKVRDKLSVLRQKVAEKLISEKLGQEEVSQFKCYFFDEPR
jgi:hypothetical protein